MRLIRLTSSFLNPCISLAAAACGIVVFSTLIATAYANSLNASLDQIDARMDRMMASLDRSIAKADRIIAELKEQGYRLEQETVDNEIGQSFTKVEERNWFSGGAM